VSDAAYWQFDKRNELDKIMHGFGSSEHSVVGEKSHWSVQWCRRREC